MKFWLKKDMWLISAVNTFICLLGCSIGDFATILYFQYFTSIKSIIVIMPIAIINGIITSVMLETVLLWRRNKIPFKDAIKMAMGMSLVSMITMELAMNFTDIMIEGSLVISLSSVLPVLLVGFIVPWPYNYWRLVKYKKSCCG